MADPQVVAVSGKFRAELANVCKALILEIDANLREATPVEFGHAHANWVPSVGTAFVLEAPGSGDAAHVDGVAQVMRFKLGDGDLFEANNVPYIGRLIGGSSSQAAAGWDLVAIEQAIQTVQGQYDGVTIDLSAAIAGAVDERGGGAAGNVAGAYSPFGEDI